MLNTTQRDNISEILGEIANIKIQSKKNPAPTEQRGQQAACDNDHPPLVPNYQPRES